MAWYLVKHRDNLQVSSCWSHYAPFEALSLPSTITGASWELQEAIVCSQLGREGGYLSLGLPHQVDDPSTLYVLISFRLSFSCVTSRSPFPISTPAHVHRLPDILLQLPVISPFAALRVV